MAKVHIIQIVQIAKQMRMMLQEDVVEPQGLVQLKWSCDSLEM